MAVVTCTFLFTNAAYASQWARIYRSGLLNSANSVQPTTDGGYIVAGEVCVPGGVCYDAWVLKLDAGGNVAWQKTYGGTDADRAYAVQQTTDGGYIVAGEVCLEGSTCYDAWVLKLDAGGNVVWQKTYGGIGSVSAYAVQQTTDGGYILAGEAIDLSNGGWNAWLLKLDSSGNVTWQKNYGGASADGAKSVQQTRDGGYVVAGYTNSYGAGGNDAWLLKLDASGNVIWQKTYGGSSGDVANAVRQTPDGGYIVAGNSSSFGAGFQNAWVLKLDGSGNIIWQKVMGNTGVGYSASGVQPSADGGYIVAGSGNVVPGSSPRGAVWLSKLDASGIVIWQEAYAAAMFDDASSVQVTTDGGYIVAGNARDRGAGTWNALVLRLDGSGAINGCANVTASSATSADSSANVGNSTAAVTTGFGTPGSTTVTPASPAVVSLLQCNYEPSVATNIPTLSEWALAVLATFVATLGFVYMRQKS